MSRARLSDDLLKNYVEYVDNISFTLTTGLLHSHWNVTEKQNIQLVTAKTAEAMKAKDVLLSNPNQEGVDVEGRVSALNAEISSGIEILNTALKKNFDNTRAHADKSQEDYYKNPEQLAASAYNKMKDSPANLIQLMGELTKKRDEHLSAVDDEFQANSIKIAYESFRVYFQECMRNKNLDVEERKDIEVATDRLLVNLKKFTDSLESENKEMKWSRKIVLQKQLTKHSVEGGLDVALFGACADYEVMGKASQVIDSIEQGKLKWYQEIVYKFCKLFNSSMIKEVEALKSDIEILKSGLNTEMRALHDQSIDIAAETGIER